MYFRHVLPVNRTVSEFVPNSCRRVSRVTTTGDHTDFPKSKMASTNVFEYITNFVSTIMIRDNSLVDDGLTIFQYQISAFKFSCEKNRSHFLFYLDFSKFIMHEIWWKFGKSSFCKFYNFYYKIWSVSRMKID